MLAHMLRAGGLKQPIPHSALTAFSSSSLSLAMVYLWPLPLLLAASLDFSLDIVDTGLWRCP